MLNVNEIFESISGETGIIPQGAITTFIRLQGCNLHCTWCDTQKAQEVDYEGINAKEVSDIVKKEVATKNVIITGGEPLLQGQTLQLTRQLINYGHVVQIETNGSIKPSSLFPPQTCFVFDYKLLSSGMTEMMMPIWMFNEIAINRKIFIKFVYCGKDDIFHAIRVMEKFKKPNQAVVPRGVNRNADITFVFSPINGGNNPGMKVKEAQALLLQYAPSIYRSSVVFSIQLHKLLDMR